MSPAVDGALGEGALVQAEARGRGEVEGFRATEDRQLQDVVREIQ